MSYYGNFYGGLGCGSGWGCGSFRRLGCGWGCGSFRRLGCGWGCGSFPRLGWGWGWGGYGSSCFRPLCYGGYGFSNFY
uniref:Uncharacterized protein n=1 Tax=Ursus maritimus TaxID=29073 RepID=A0A452UPH7_URSMA